MPDRPLVRVLIAGLPASGKTTFVAALWHVLSNARQTRFEVYDFMGNYEYVNRLEQFWLAAEQLPRTIRRSEVRISMKVRDRESGWEFELCVPDLSGEDFLKYFARREWPESLDQFIHEAHGIVLFVNPEHVARPTAMADVFALAEAAGAEVIADDRAGAIAGKPWDPEQTATAVVLVDMLNSISERQPRRSRPLRVALVVSAWDTMRDVNMSPEEWLKRDLPFLYQYVLTNPDRYECKVFGVSAQGGDVSDPEIRARLLRIPYPADRVEVVSDDARISKDLSVPVGWIACK